MPPINFILFFKIIILIFVTPGYSKIISDKIILGASLSLTGNKSNIGQHVQKGYDLGVKIINETGGINVGGKKYNLEIQYYDDESNSSRSTALVERLIQYEGVDYLLGPSDHEAVLKILPVVEKLNVPMVNTTQLPKFIDNKNYKYSFNIFNISDQYLFTAVDLIKEKIENPKISLLVESNEIFNDISLSIIEKTKSEEIEVVLEEFTDDETTDIPKLLKKIETTDSDLIILAGNSLSSFNMLEQIIALKIDFPMIVISNCNSEEIKQKIGSLANYIMCSTQWHNSFLYKDDNVGNFNDYFKIFESTYDYQPPIEAAKSTAAIFAYKDAFERADSFNRNKISNALVNIDLMTFFGPIKFDEHKQNIIDHELLFQIQNEEDIVVAPNNLAEGNLIFPIPKWSER
jgi:branched-chain amino acid transport system substrate-binding protein